MWPPAVHSDDPAMQPSGISLAQKRRTSPQKRSGGAARGTPTTFFFRTEDELDQSSSNNPAADVEDSTYGVQSLASNVSSAYEDRDESDLEPSTQDSQPEASINSGLADHISGSALTTKPPGAPLYRTTSESSSDSSPSRPLPHDVSAIARSGRLTPLHMYSPVGDNESGPASTPKSVSLRSLQLSEDGSAVDDAASQAITSGDEEDDDKHEQADQSQDAPQLVMPNLRMPTRRPFTARGKEIGKLKILVAGGKGVGKTSLIKSIVQACEDIVHVDPLTSSSLTITNSERRHTKTQTQLQNSLGTDRITEIFASTRAYPSWWSDLGESRILRRRQSMGEQVLERNICFVDTPGFDQENPSRQSINAIIEHVEASLRRNISFASLGDGELLSILSGSGGVQVDLILYVFSKEPTAYDLDLIRRLCEFSLIVPVVSKADLLSGEDLASLSNSIAKDMRTADISITDLETATWPSPLSRSTWAVSSATGNDDENMDASLLMSPDYIQPLAPSDLPALVSHIFDPEKAAWLRHMAVKKCLRWRRTHSEIISTAQSFNVQIPTVNTGPASSPIAANTGIASPASSLFSSTSPSHVLVSHPSSLQLTTAALQQPYHLSGATVSASPSPFTVARFADHTQREELLAQARLARWATDLQKSLQNERERFETLQRDERRGWLLERWGEVQQQDSDGNGDADDAAKSGTPVAQLARRHKAALDPLDPLGLLAWDERVRRSGLVVVKVLGGCGVLGAMVVWVARHWGLDLLDGGLFGGDGVYWPPHVWFVGGSGD